MSDTVATIWGLQCPRCGNCEQIDIVGTIWMRLCPEGTDVTEAENGDHEWSESSPAQCGACGFAGTVTGFTIEEERHP